MKAPRACCLLSGVFCLTCYAADVAPLRHPALITDPVERLRTTLARVTANPGDQRHCILSAAAGLEFGYRDPRLEEAARLFDDITCVLEAAPRSHMRSYEIRWNAQYARSNADALRSTPQGLPLAELWQETARAVGDIDGGGRTEVIVAARHGDKWFGQRVFLVFAEHGDGHRLVWGRMGGPDVHALDLRDFDGDGDTEVVARVFHNGFGNAGGGCVHQLQIMEPTGAPLRLRTALQLPLKTVNAWWRGGSYYDEVTASWETRDEDGDGRNDIVVRFERREGDFVSHDVCRSPEPFTGYEPTPVLRVDTHLRRGDRFVLDAESTRRQWTRLLGRAAAMPPEEGIRFAKRIERDFVDVRDAIYNITMRVEDRPVVFPTSSNYVKAKHHLTLGRTREAYELFLRSRKTAETCEHLGRMCEDHFREPAKAAEWYAKAIKAGANTGTLQPKIEALRREQAGVRYRPLRPGEIADCKPHELRAIARDPVWEGQVSWWGRPLWLDDSRLLLVGRRTEKEPLRVWSIDVTGAHEPKVLHVADAAARSRTELLMRRGRDHERRLLLGGIGGGEVRPWPGGVPRYGMERLCLSPEGRWFLSARSRGGCEGYGKELSLSEREGGTRVILERCGTSDLLGWTAEGNAVVRVDGDLRVYDTGKKRWRDLKGSHPGPGSYDACFSPSGTHSASLGRDYRQTRGGILWIAREGGVGECPLDFEREYESSTDLPSWSPDGTRLLMIVYDRPGKTDLVTRVYVLTLGRRETIPSRADRAPREGCRHSGVHSGFVASSARSYAGTRLPSARSASRSGLSRK